jgi:hypothetical protein
MEPSAFEIAVPTVPLPPAIPFTCSVTAGLSVPLTIKPRFSEFETRTSVPEFGSSVSTTRPGPTFMESGMALADPGLGLVTVSG